MPIRLRPARPDDAEPIARLHLAAWQVGYRGILTDELLDGLDADGWIARRRSHLEAPTPGIFNLVAEQGGQVAGWASGGPARDVDDDPALTGEIYAVYVDPTRWRGGAGRALLGGSIDALQGLGYQQATLWVLEENPRARGLYESAGMALDGGRKPCGVRGITSPSVRYRLRLGGPTTP